MKKPTKAQKARAAARVAIALDVIAQIKASRYKVQSGIYIQGLDTTPGDMGKSVDLRKQLNKTLKPSKPCTVCALGSAFLSCVRLYDQFQLNSKTVSYPGSIDYMAMKRKLREFFTNSELSAIESSFERHPMGTVGYNRWHAAPVGYRTFLRSLDSEDRLIWLMTAVSRIDDQSKVTLTALQQQALITIATDAKYAKDGCWQTVEKFNYGNY